MTRVNRDVVVALLLLLFCGVFFWESFNIRLTDYGQMNSAVWPRALLAALALASVIYLAQALRGDFAAETKSEDGAPEERGLLAWLASYRNAFFCYGLFLLFLLTLPVFGMLIGGILFVFLALTVLGSLELRLVPIHAAVAVGTVGAMWAVFTFGLRVFLPEGMLISFN
ncbi:hypothetical protein HBA54_08095 [Pelagibius litoralis]|uniref:DUF1468 domain-containing protein n=1 Tax=Pelagibius litoralis TaxID=374515 RepID=A0A967C4Z9_9PROT|nr:tripartite tricarboxylate transporter TctB family protein [Pelagibius litoralis]NIA68550.1 hypothetical protein [Pelagibius litoralis]